MNFLLQAFSEANGNPSSMRGLAEAFVAAGHSVEVPRLPGHGTSVEDMLTTGWEDWSAEAEAALGRLAGRTERQFVAGLSMDFTGLRFALGGLPAIAVTFWAGLICWPAHPVWFRPWSAFAIGVIAAVMINGVSRRRTIGADAAIGVITSALFAASRSIASAMVWRRASSSSRSLLMRSNFSASSAERASLTPPPLPRPPA